MWEWSDKLKLGKSSAFVKQDLRPLAADRGRVRGGFLPRPRILDQTPGTVDGHGRRAGVRRPSGDGRRALPPPTVNDLATLLAHAMRGRRMRKIVSGPARSIFGIVPNGRNCCLIFGNLASRSSWATICPGSTRRSSSGCSREDEEAVFHRRDQGGPSQAVPREKTKFVHRCDGPHGVDGCDVQGSVSVPKVAVPSYDPMTVVPIHLAADELEAILTKTRIAKTKKLRPRLEAMAAETRPSTWTSAIGARFVGPVRTGGKKFGPQAVARDCHENCQPTGRGVRN